LIHRIKEDKNLEEIQRYKDLLKYFITIELINWKQLCSTYEAKLKFGSASSPATHVFNTKLEDGAKRWTDFKNRVVEHNIRVMAKYYTRVRAKRMADL
jgi:26S proteasome regulatory subunit N5